MDRGVGAVPLAHHGHERHDSDRGGGARRRRATNEASRPGPQHEVAILTGSEDLGSGERLLRCHRSGETPEAFASNAPYSSWDVRDQPFVHSR